MGMGSQMKRACPACTIRAGHLIDPECPICHGNGTLTLHPAALSVYDSETVANAIGIACEATARTIDAGSTLTEDQLGLLANRMRQLEAAGIIRAQPPAEKPRDNVRPLRRQVPGQGALTDTHPAPVMVAAEYSPDQPALFDLTLIEARPHTYGEDDRPMMRGLPILSATGHPSSLARITDPVDQLVSTRETVRTRAVAHRKAVTLLAAVPETIDLKNRKTG